MINPLARISHQLMRPRLSFCHQRARVHCAHPWAQPCGRLSPCKLSILTICPSTIATAMLSVAGTRWRHKSARSRFGRPKDARRVCAMEGEHLKSCAIIASTGEKCGLRIPGSASALWMGDLFVPALIVFGVCAISTVLQPVQAETDPAPISVIRTEVAEDMDDRVQAAYRAYQAGNLVAAKSGYTDVLSVYPDNRDAMLGLAACAVREGDIKSAVSMYLRIIRAFPQDALSRAALIGLQQNRQEEPVIRQLLSKQADNPFLYATLGKLLAAQTRWPEARQAFSAAHRIDPANPVYALNLAISLDRMGQRDEALSYYRATLKLVESGASDLDIRPVVRRIHSLRRP